MTLKLIPAGEFMMGSPDNDTDAENDEKPHERRSQATTTLVNNQSTKGYTFQSRRGFAQYVAWPGRDIQARRDPLEWALRELLVGGQTSYDLTYEARRCRPSWFGGGFRQGDGQHYGLALGGPDHDHRLNRWSSNSTPQYSVIQSIPGTIEPLKWYNVKISVRRQRIRIELDDRVLFLGTDDFKLRGSVSLAFFDFAGRSAASK